MFKQVLATVSASASLLAVASILADAPAKQPVFILLYTQISDHTHLQLASERIQRLLPALQSDREKYSKYHPSAVFQFSGTMADVLAGLDKRLPLVQRLKDAARQGTVEFGYAGEPEPTYHHRPRPNFLGAATPEERWTARAEAGEHFLADYKNPLNGEPFPGLAGGLKRTQEVFGEVSYISGLDTKLGGNSPLINQLRKYNEHAVLLGYPSPNAEFGIHGYGAGLKEFSNRLSPVSNTAPDLYWDDGYLHSSEFSLGDVRSLSTEDGPEALQKALDKLDRSHVRVIHIEYGGYKRYLKRRQDGSVVYDPLEWAYTHPDEPDMPSTLNAFADRKLVDQGYDKDEAVMRWLAESFFPANPGSRFVSAADLKKMAQTPDGSEFTAADLEALASDLHARFVEMHTIAPNFAKVGDRYLSLADSFELLATALADSSQGSPAAKIKLTGVYGPLAIPGGMGPTGKVTVRQVIAAAAQLAPRLRDNSWKSIPNNAVPWKVTVATLDLNPAQFLHLMADAYLDLQPDKTLEIKQCTSLSLAAQDAPRSWPFIDDSNAWTYRPAPLSLP